MEIGTTKMSSKGQIVIPVGMRKEFKQGIPIVVLLENGQIILKKATEVSKNFMGDLEFARLTEQAYQRYERGEFKEMDGEEFLKEIRTW